LLSKEEVPELHRSFFAVVVKVFADFLLPFAILINYLSLLRSKAVIIAGVAIAVTKLVELVVFDIFSLCSLDKTVD
jgi:hypothetical protein